MINRYLVFRPEVQGDIFEEWRNCLEQIKKVNLTEDRLVKLNIFTNPADYSDYISINEEIRNSLLNCFNNQCPAFNVTVNLPEKPRKVVVEAGFMSTSSCNIVSKVWHSVQYIVRTTDVLKEVWAAGLGTDSFPGNTRKSAAAAFEQMRSILAAENMSFDHIVRQWNFIGNILEIKNEIQNYQTFNEVRSENYHRYRNIDSYPAATGVGMKFGGVRLDFCALKAENNLRIIAIDNPDQIRPYDYSQQVLKGRLAGGKGIMQPPQFERAVFLADSSGSTLFISGTASITGQETIGIDDVEKQTNATLENIGKLSDSTRIGHLTGNADYVVGNLTILRVYIKKQEYFPTVKKICNERFPGVPAVFIESDICRDNLLVEIEGEFSNFN